MNGENFTLNLILICNKQNHSFNKHQIQLENSYWSTELSCKT
jgi:hypothetical protein